MKLSHVPGSRSCRVRWLLEELGIEYELESFSLGDAALRSSDYRARNPLGRVPTLDDGGVAFYESGAILQYLLERYGGGRLEPEVGAADRPIYLQWFHWGEATLMPPMAIIMANRFVLKPEDRSEAALSVGRRQLANALKVLEEAVAGRNFLLEDFSAADIQVAYGVSLSRMVGELPDSFPEIVRWVDQLGERPAYKKAFEGGFG